MPSNNERLEALLNRAGQTISDLPAEHTAANRLLALDVANMWPGGITSYVCHLSDVIDRMEWALNNTLVELAHVKEVTKYNGD